ncbi:docking protein 2 [Bombina bombina]|uniref:docking protein 2 n=1 Tax=Bombina bombina TaxID=8345 RepID=UPI00235A9B19|nr:docking protein 2 [Bombina bombina]
MESGIVKQGALHLQHQQRFGKKWKKVWGILHGSTSTGLARLEIYEGSQPSEHGRKAECFRLIQLSDCVSVSDRSGEQSPKDTRSFSIETTQRIHLLACETSEQSVWIKTLCSIAFPQERLERRSSQVLNAGGLQLQENSLYSTSRAVGNHFEVWVRQTEASIRCGLSGIYTLTAESSSLSLRERQTGNLLYSWPYPFLRRFGRDKTMFSFEAGRRCTSGEGNFEFETSQGGHIFQAIENAISCNRSNTTKPSGQAAEESTSRLLQHSAISPALQKNMGFQASCHQVNSRPKPSTPEESEYAVPFDKVARSLLASGFGGLMEPPPITHGKVGKVRRAEHIYDEPESHNAPVYDEPEGVRVDAWRTQGTDAHNLGYEFPYLPGRDDYAVPRLGASTQVKELPEEDDGEWGNADTKDREYDNITLRGGQ